MADDGTGSSDSTNSNLLAQLLMLLQQGQGGSQATNAQLGSGGVADAANPGSSPDASIFNNATATSLPTSGMSDTALQNWYAQNQGSTVYNPQGKLIQIPSMQSGGSADQGNSYGMAAPSQGGTPEPGTIRAWMNAGQNGGPSGILNGASLTNPQGNQLNSMLQSLLKQQQAPAAPSAPPPPPAPIPSVPDVQAAYTDPSKAVIPGMNLSQQLQQGMPQSAIMAQGGPLQASTGSNLQIPAQYIPRPADNAGTAALVNASGSAATPSPIASIGSGATSALTSAIKMYQQQNQNPFSAASRSYGPGGTTQDLGSVDSTAAQPLGAAGQNWVQGGLDMPSGADAPALGDGGANFSQGGLDAGVESSGAADGAASVGGGAGAAGAASAGIGLIQGIGSALEKMYTPIKLRQIPEIQQPQSPVFTSPKMIG
jgi:hypothetical protein